MAADPASTFLETARRDLRAVERLLLPPALDDELIGFHCQQAVEKALKSVLVRVSGSFEPTHDLQRIISSLAANGVALPTGLAGCDALTPFAVPHRYGFSPASSSLSARSCAEWAKNAVVWATSHAPPPAKP